MDLQISLVSFFQAVVIGFIQKSFQTFYFTITCYAITCSEHKSAFRMVIRIKHKSYLLPDLIRSSLVNALISIFISVQDSSIYLLSTISSNSCLPDLFIIRSFSRVYFSSSLNPILPLTISLPILVE